jgi:hypothetical protein
MDDDRALVGVGGWLAFFVLSFAVLTPLRTAITLVVLISDPAIAAGYGDAWGLLISIEVALAAATMVGAWYCAYRLLKVEVWRTVLIVLAALWLIGPATFVIDLLLVTLLADVPLATLIEETFLDGLRSLVYAVIWTAYFLMSQRVANTYEGRYPEEVAERFA